MSSIDINVNKVSSIHDFVNEALNERREDDIPEIPASSENASILKIFDRYVVDKAQENPVATTVSIVALVTLSASLLAIAAIVTVVAGAVILALGLALIGVKILAVLKKTQKDKIAQELNQLELMGILNAKEAHAIKQTLHDLDLTRNLVINLQQNNLEFKDYLKSDGKDGFCARIGLDAKKLRFEDIAIADKQLTSKERMKVGDKLLECIKSLQESSYIDQLKEYAQNNELGAFRSSLIGHYKELSDKNKDNKVAYYCFKEMANKIESVPEHETYIIFIRFTHQLNMLKKHNQLLANIVKGLSEYTDNDLQKWMRDFDELKQLDELHKYSSALLSDYHVVSSEVDEIFAYYRGEFAVKYRNIEASIAKINNKFNYSQSLKFSELPLSPGLIRNVKIGSPKKEEVISHKVWESEYNKIVALCRSVMELSTINEGRAEAKESVDNESVFVKEATSGKELSKSLNPEQVNSIMLVTCSFGTGHKITARAIKDLIGPSSHVSIVDPTEYDGGILVKETDWIYKLGRLLGKKWSSTIVFNWILQEQHYWMVNLENKIDKFIRSLFKIGGKNGVAPSARGVETKSKELLRHRILMERPNLITTTYHMDLNPFLEVAEELGLPLLHVPTDLDVKMAEVFGDNRPEYEHFRIVLPDSNEETLETARILREDQIHMVTNEGSEISVTGIVLRPEFYIQRTPEEIQQLKEEAGIDPEATVIAVMSGGNGQDLPYPEMLLNSVDNGKKYHMIVVVGGNTAAGNALNAKRKEGERFIRGSNPNVTVQVLEDPTAATKTNPYYVSGKAISRMHAVADVGITKPGGLSIAEFMQTGVPMIPDRRKDPMKWEDFNIGVLNRQNRARAYTGRENFLDLIDEVKALGKKPKPNRAGLIMQQMAVMINKAEDDTDASIVQRRKYLTRGIKL